MQVHLLFYNVACLTLAWALNCQTALYTWELKTIKVKVKYFVLKSVQQYHSVRVRKSVTICCRCWQQSPTRVAIHPFFPELFPFFIKNPIREAICPVFWGKRKNLIWFPSSCSLETFGRFGNDLKHPFTSRLCAMQLECALCCEVAAESDWPNFRGEKQVRKLLCLWGFLTSWGIFFHIRYEFTK